MRKGLLMEEREHPIEKLLTSKQIAECLQISHWKVEDMLRSGTLAGIKVEGQWRVRPAAYQEYLDNLSKPKTK